MVDKRERSRSAGARTLASRTAGRPRARPITLCSAPAAVLGQTCVISGWRSIMPGRCRARRAISRPSHAPSTLIDLRRRALLHHRAYRWATVDTSTDRLEATISGCRRWPVYCVRILSGRAKPVRTRRSRQLPDTCPCASRAKLLSLRRRLKCQRYARLAFPVGYARANSLAKIPQMTRMICIRACWIWLHLIGEEFAVSLNHWPCHSRLAARGRVIHSSVTCAHSFSSARAEFGLTDPRACRFEDDGRLMST